jgi:glycosyltransferase involved in cell wall biosynthesis
LPPFSRLQRRADFEETYDEIPKQVVDDIILTDDSSADETISLAKSLGIHTLVHDANRGYGGNRKTCYRVALESGADIVVMLHPDYQYSPRLVPAMASMVRASPLMPFVATSYLPGLSVISLRDYMLGTLAALPALLGYVSLGAFARAGLSSSTSAALPFNGRCWRWGLRRRRSPLRMSGRSSPRLRRESKRRQPDANGARK